MNTNLWVGPIAALLGVAVGILVCFWGYRLLKVILALAGLVAGATAGWELGTSIVSGTSAVPLLCAIVGGVLGAALCVWLFFLGIFLVGASAGVVIAAGALNGTGHETQPLLVLAAAILFGVLALAMQKLMVVVATAFSGSYLITAGLLQVVTGWHNPSLMWFNHGQPAPAGTLDYVALALWIVLGLAGLMAQFTGNRRRDEAMRQEVQTA